MSSRGKLKKRNSAIKEQQEKILVGYYKRNLIVFLERELNVKLTGWQKFILKRVQKGLNK